MTCPKCAGTLARLEIDGVEVDRCASCGGIWFDKGELGPLLDGDTGKIRALLGGEDPDHLDARRGRCPRHEKPLLRVTSARNPDVRIETCGVCQGVWLDGGEFERIKRARPGVKLGDLV
jgi:Zn-finger nucleic acid-binding protein